jgi:histidyl-tRNA synthetase
MGLDEARIRGLLGAVDKFERNGDGAFAGYEGAFGPIDASLKAKLLSFLAIRSFPEIEAALGPNPPAVIAARLSDWRKLLGGLSDMGLGDFIQVDLGVVRGLAYYTGFVFEAFDRKGELRALAGGGRYDDLVGKLGGSDLPAVGFAIGDMTFALLLDERGLTPVVSHAPDVYCVIGGAVERKAAFADILALRAIGYRVEYPLKDVAFGKQLRAAVESGAKAALIYGSDELGRGVVKLRDLGDRTEREFPLGQVAESVRGFLSGS